MVSLAEAIPGVSVVPPTGAFYLFLDVSACLEGGSASTAVELAEALLEDAGVGVIPGEAFGAPGYLRLSFAVSSDDIREGMARLGTFLTS